MIETNKVYEMEALELLKQLPDNSIDLVLTDPPYNINKADWDNFENYLEWCENWLEECKRVLKPNGSIYVFASYYWVSYLSVIMDKKFKLINWIIWNYRSGFGVRTKWASRYEPILFYVMNEKNYTFNLDEVRIPHRCPDKRNNPIGRNPTDVWDIERISGNYKERTKHPTQKPLEVIKRIIQASSNKGEIILDCFGGSGTTAVACKELGRNFICSDINEEYVKIANSRLSETAPVVTLASPTFPTEKAINKDLKVSATPTPKEFPSEIPSLNPDIMRNFCLRKNSKVR